MSVNPIASNNSGLESLMQGHSENTAKTEDPLGRDAFMTMLVAQLQHQDPLNPMDGTAFTAQLAQFSSLEQQFNMNDNLKEILASLNNDSESNLLDYIGKQVLSQDNTIKISQGAVSGGHFTLEAPARISVAIYDASGQEIMRSFLGHLEAGTHAIGWNGFDNAGNRSEDGTYSYVVAASDDSGASVPVQTTLSGMVSGVGYGQDGPYLLVEDNRVDPATVVKAWIPE